MASRGLSNPLVKTADPVSLKDAAISSISPRESHSPQKLHEPRWQVVASLLIVIGGGLIYLAVLLVPLLLKH